MKIKFTTLSVIISAIAFVVSVGTAMVSKTILGGVYTSDTTQPVIVISSQVASSSVLNALTVGTSTLINDTGTTSTIPNTMLGIDTNLAGLRGVVVQGVVGQTANLFEARYATSTVVWYIDPNGNMFASGSIRESGHLLPSSNNLYDVGAFGNAWRDIYASSTLLVGNGTASTTLSSNGNLNVGGRVFVRGGATNGSGLQLLTNTRLTWSNATGNGFIQGDDTLGLHMGWSADQLVFDSNGVNLYTTFRPNTNNSRDLGLFGAAFANVYASGTVRAASTTIDNGIQVKNTASIGWSVVAASDQACNTTCTDACVIGFASAVTGSDPVSCTNTSADSCLCAGL